eukprot:TRINITY_DN20818_c0_g1_i2.p1 TRINITY_DN20818_c0_g1~~TRINITY_DN20818_c0_g1_i2.p1  ORF type:complete len:156 (+),score=11.45 TRINITY_DN20818_c0_g1_i2:304-771(+)
MNQAGPYSMQTASWTTRPVGQWTTGLCGCCEDMPSCCCTLFCPCVIAGQNIEILSDGRTGCSTAGIIWYAIQQVTGFLGFCYTCGYRGRLRQKYQLPSACPDCIVHCFCFPCALCQETRELKNRGWDPAITFNGNVAIFQKLTGNVQPPPFQQMS